MPSLSALAAMPAGPGGKPAAEIARPVFGAVGAKTVDLGEALGDACALKLACNAWIASLTTAMAQSLTQARSLGVDQPRPVKGRPARAEAG